MIETKYDMTLSSDICNEKFDGEKDFLDIIGHKKQEKRNGNGEDINITMLVILDELYQKSSIFGDTETHLESKTYKSAIDNSSRHELLKSKKNSQVHPSVETHKSVDDLNRVENLTSAKSRMLSTEFTVPATLETRSHISEHREEIHEDQVKEINQLAGRVTNDLTQYRHELSRQDIPLRKPQPSVVDPNLLSPIEMTIRDKSSRKQSIHIDYSFLRWAGDHSVKVAIPLERSALQRLTLHPSDTRAAEVIARQTNQLYDFKTELLHPQQDDEDPESKSSHYSREEDKE